MKNYVFKAFKKAFKRFLKPDPIDMSPLRKFYYLTGVTMRGKSDIFYKDK